jgi:hypothetical protein
MAQGLRPDFGPGDALFDVQAGAINWERSNEDLTKEDCPSWQSSFGSIFSQSFNLPSTNLHFSSAD